MKKSRFPFFLTRYETRMRFFFGERGIKADCRSVERTLKPKAVTKKPWIVDVGKNKIHCHS